MVQTLLMDNPEIIPGIILLITATLTVLALRSLWKRYRSPEENRGPWWRAVGAGVLVVAAGFPTVGISNILLVEQVPARITQSRLIDQPISLDYQLVSDGMSKSLSDHQGSVVLVTIWATWCPACRTEMPELDRLQQEHRDQGLVVVTVSDEDQATLGAYFKNHPLVTENAFVASRPWQTVTQPTSYLIDRQGTLRQIIRGRRGYDSLVEAVEGLL